MCVCVQDCKQAYTQILAYIRIHIHMYSSKLILSLVSLFYLHLHSLRKQRDPGTEGSFARIEVPEMVVVLR